MNIHFIAIGGAAMHNLAIALHKKGHQISGSDDEIFDPAQSNLSKHGLLPKENGWFPEKISSTTEAIILGMHARKDNPELLKAQELNIPIYSYPEFVYHQTQNKTRIVVGGSHGKTTITSMIMHVLQKQNKKFDYLVGAQLAGFDTMVGLSEEAEIAVIEGDEYLASPIQMVPKFHLYFPDIAIISGIAWDHINVFPTYEMYCEQFSIFIDKIQENGRLIYCENDKELVRVVNENKRESIKRIPYGVPPHEIEDGITSILFEGKKYPLEVFGQHNLMNLESARLACEAVGVSTHDFYTAMESFSGAAKRLETLVKKETAVVYKDFAHSPSKLKASIEAVKQQYPTRKLFAVMELHTFSSLNKAFLNEYKDAMQSADEAVVFYSPQTIAHKRLEPISIQEIKEAFGQENLIVIDNAEALAQYFSSISLEQSNVLLMSSGNWGGLQLTDFFA